MTVIISSSWTEIVSALVAKQKAYLQQRKTIPMTHDASLDTREEDVKMKELLAFKVQEEV